MRKTILDAQGVKLAIDNMAEEIITGNTEGNNLVLVGIRTGGVFLARRLADALAEKSFGRVPTGAIDINLYRDDWTRAHPKPKVGKTELNFSIDNKKLLLVDDVLFTGRTVRAALDALMDFGRPAKIELVVLADRGHRELPICANITGLKIETTLDERVNVYFSEQGNEDRVTVEKA